MYIHWLVGIIRWCVALNCVGYAIFGMMQTKVCSNSTPVSTWDVLLCIDAHNLRIRFLRIDHTINVDDSVRALPKPSFAEPRFHRIQCESANVCELLRPCKLWYEMSYLCDRDIAHLAEPHCAYASVLMMFIAP